MTPNRLSSDFICPNIPFVAHVAGRIYAPDRRNHVGRYLLSGAYCGLSKIWNLSGLPPALLVTTSTYVQYIRANTSSVRLEYRFSGTRKCDLVLKNRAGNRSN